MRRSRTFRILLVALLGVGPLSGADPSPKRKPRNALEDVNRIGNRNVTGILNLFSMRQDIQLGRQFARRVDARVKLVRDPVIAEFVNRIGQNLGKNSDFKLPLTIQVIKDERINAVALPGGFFYVNTGLIHFARDEAELAGVMAHEIAHIAGRHGTRSLSRAHLAKTTAEELLQKFGGYNWGTNVAVVAANVALPLIFLKFSRTFEKKADFLGVQYLYKTGYDPLSMVTFFERLTAIEGKKTGAITRAFSSHPHSAKRIVLIQKAIDELLPDRPYYANSNSEFESIKVRLVKLYGAPKYASSDGDRPRMIRRTQPSQ